MVECRSSWEVCPEHLVPKAYQMLTRDTCYCILGFALSSFSSTCSTPHHPHLYIPCFQLHRGGVGLLSLCGLRVSIYESLSIKAAPSQAATTYTAASIRTFDLLLWGRKCQEYAKPKLSYLCHTHTLLHYGNCQYYCCVFARLLWEPGLAFSTTSIPQWRVGAVLWLKTWFVLVERTVEVQHACSGTLLCVSALLSMGTDAGSMKQWYLTLHNGLFWQVWRMQSFNVYLLWKHARITHHLLSNKYRWLITLSEPNIPFNKVIWVLLK